MDKIDNKTHCGRQLETIYYRVTESFAGTKKLKDILMKIIENGIRSGELVLSQKSKV